MADVQIPAADVAFRLGEYMKRMRATLGDQSIRPLVDRLSPEQQNAFAGVLHALDALIAALG